MVIMHNVMASDAKQKLGLADKKITKNVEILSSGYKINRAADNVAGLAISEGMRGQIRGLDRANRNTEDGLSLIQTADGCLNEVTQVLHRIRELSVQAANDTLTSKERLMIQNEVNVLVDEVEHIGVDSEFNTMKLFRTDPEGDRRSDKLDIVFCIDVTGSMGKKIEKVKNSIDSFVRGLERSGTDVNLGLVTFEDKDKVTPCVYYDDVEDFKKKIGDIHLGDGKDAPEAGLEAIMEAYANPGRSDADRHFILVTDAAVHSKDKDEMKGIICKDEAAHESEYSIEEVTAQLKSSNIGITVVGIEGTSSHATQLKTISQKAGGKYLNIERDFSRSLLHLAKELAGMTPSYRTLQIGSNAGQLLDFPVFKLSPTSLGIEGISVRTREGAEDTIGRVDDALDKISGYRAKYGAIYNRLEHTADNLSNSSENLTAAESKLRDADMADEIAKLACNQIVLQAGQSVLVQANNMPQNVTRLLGGV